MITGLEHNYRGLIPPPALSDQHTDIATSRNHSTGTDDSTVPRHAIKDNVVR